MHFRSKLDALDADEAKAALIDLYAFFSDPSFGAPKAEEFKIYMFETLRRLGVFSDEASSIEVGRVLNMTQSRAQSLINNADARREDLTDERLDNRLRDAILNSAFEATKDQRMILEIDRVIVRDHMKKRLGELGFLSDSAFNPNLVKIKHAGIAALMVKLVAEADQDRLKQKLIRAGAPDTSLKGIMKLALRGVVRKVVGRSGDLAFGAAAHWLSSLIPKEGVEELTETELAPLFDAEDADAED